MTDHTNTHSQSQRTRVRRGEGTCERGAWFLDSAPKPNRKHQLFCFPYAGGSASIYARWQHQLPPELDVWCVELPGRHGRMTEPHRRSIVALAQELAPVVAAAANTDFSFLGCSMGAIVAFEVARALRDGGVKQASRIFALAANGPHRAGGRSSLHQLHDDELLRQVSAHYEAIPRALLQLAELRELVLRPLRADLEAIETYEYRDAPPLTCPITLLTGSRDRAVDDDAHTAWRRHTSELEHRVIDGGHFFVTSAVQAVLEQVMQQTLRARPLHGASQPA